MNAKVDFYFDKETKWGEEIKLLRSIVLDCHLAEELKWGCPCYVFDKKNIVLIHVFKEYCALLFFQGALIKDDNGILIQQTENVQVARQARFTNVKEIKKVEKTLKAYIFKAVENEEAGLKVKLKKTAEYKMPEEFKGKLSGKAGVALKSAFEGLTPGRQRAYLFYFSQAKQSKTREARIEKCIPQILKGKGLDD